MAEDALDVFISLNSRQADVLIAICNVDIQVLILKGASFSMGAGKFAFLDVDIKSKDHNSGFFSAGIIINDGSVNDICHARLRSYEEINHISFFSFNSIRDVLADFDDSSVVKDNVGGSQVDNDFVNGRGR